MKDKLIIAGKGYSSRLLVGTGKYKDFAETKAAVESQWRRDHHDRDPPPATSARTRTRPVCWRSCRRPSTRLLTQHRRLLHPPRTRCGRYGWRANCWTGTAWSNWKCWATAQSLYPNVIETNRRRQKTLVGRFPGDGVHLG